MEAMAAPNKIYQERLCDMSELKINLKEFLPDAHPKICLLRTDIVEPEILIRLLAAETSKRFPAAFKGEVPQVFYRMRYVPPYETFQEIRNLILQIRNATGIRSRFHGMIAIDVSEYKGHEDEEFFTILLKYLYDNMCGCKTILVCSQYAEKEYRRLLSRCAEFFPVQQQQLHVYDCEQLKYFVKASFKNHRYTIDSDSIELITDMLMSEELVPYRTIQLIDRIPEEIHIKKASCKNEQGSTFSDAVREYFLDPNSPICMLASHALLSGKEGQFEHAI